MTATVIAYHAVGDVPRKLDPYRMFMPLANFRRQMEFLATQRTVVPLDAVLEARPARKPTVTITFDDGYVSVLESAAPILAEYGFTATCFVPSHWIGGRKAWDPLDAAGAPLPIMTPAELLELQARGHWIESHGHRHVRMDRLDYDEARREIEQSLDTLEGVTGRRPHVFAYPWGAHSAAARRAAQDAGLRRAFSIGQPGNGPFASERVTIRPSDGMAVYAYKTSGFYLRSRELPLVRTAYRRLVHPMVRHRRSRAR